MPMAVKIHSKENLPSETYVWSPPSVTNIGIPFVFPFRPETTFGSAKIVCKHVLTLIAHVAFYQRLALFERH